MATQLQIRRGTSSQVAAFTGAEGEIVVNTTNDSVHVNDGSTAGGFELARADLNNVSDTSLNAALTGNTVSALTITTLTLGSTAITATGAEINILDGVTATAAELNILDGVTSTAAELNILDGVTATTAELNHVDGVTSAIQTQIDAKAPLASPTFTGTVTTAALTGTSATFTTADNSDNLTLTSTDADATTGPNVNFYRNSGSPADNDHLGEIRFTGRNDNSQDVIYANIETRIKDASDGSEDGYFDFETMLNGTLQSRLIMNETGTIFNEDSLDLDFRVESDSNTHALFVEGSSGNVLCGTTASGSAGLNVSNDFNIGFSEGSNSSLANIFRQANSGATIVASGYKHTSTSNKFESSTASAWARTAIGCFYEGIRFYTDAAATVAVGTDITPSERMRIDASGNLLVGKTSTGTAQGFEAQQDGEVYSSIVNGLNTYHVYANAAYRFYVAPNGGIYNFSANNVNLSDEREKKNIEALESQWGSLKQWSLKKFHFNADADSDTKKLGVIAQEVETHNPEVVSEFNVNENTIRMAVKEQQMMWMAIKALQEAQERIETLETKVQTLENN